MQIQGATVEISRNRKGRKRKSGRRTSGRLVAAPRIDHRASVGSQPHRNWLPASLREHERASDVLGCLNLLKRISDHEYEAGRRYCVVVAAYRQVIGAPRGTIGSGRSHACEPTSCLKDSTNCVCEMRTAQYRDATRKLILAGQRAYNVTHQVVVHEMIPNSDQLADLCCGLRALEKLFGLTNQRR